MGSPKGPETDITATSPPAAAPPETDISAAGPLPAVSREAPPQDALSQKVAALITAPEKGGFWQYLRSHPTGFWFIFWGELAERCAYYGVRALFVVYMVEVLF